jgi:hypothetical protein
MTILAKKLHLKPGMTMCVLDAPTGYQLELASLDVAHKKTLKGPIDVIQVFVTRKSQLDKRLAALKAAMAATSALWVCYPKANGLDTDLNRDLLRLGLADKGLTAVAQIAIDDVWSGLRFKLADAAPARTAKQPAGRTFTTTLVEEGGVEVPFDIEKVFGRKRMPIVVTVNGVKYRTTVAVYGGRYFFPMRRAIREQAGVPANGTCRLTIEPDLAPRVVEAPRDLMTAMRKHAPALARWKTWSYTHQKELVDWVTSAKRAETRERRIEKALAMLDR